MELAELRERIEEFVRRYGVLRVLAMAVAILLVLLLARRALRGLRAAAGPMLIVALLVAGWLLHGGW